MSSVLQSQPTVRAILRPSQWDSTVVVGREPFVSDASFNSGPAGYLPDDLSGVLRRQINVNLHVWRVVRLGTVSPRCWYCYSGDVELARLAMGPARPDRLDDVPGVTPNSPSRSLLRRCAGVACRPRRG